MSEISLNDEHELQVNLTMMIVSFSLLDSDRLMLSMLTRTGPILLEIRQAQEGPTRP